MKLNKLGDFNLVIDYYKSLLEISERIKPNIRTSSTLKSELPIMDYPRIRAMINNCAITISKNFEGITGKDNNRNKISKVSDDVIINMFKEECPWFQKINIR